MVFFICRSLCTLSSKFTLWSMHTVGGIGNVFHTHTPTSSSPSLPWMEEHAVRMCSQNMLLHWGHICHTSNTALHICHTLNTASYLPHFKTLLHICHTLNTASYSVSATLQTLLHTYLPHIKHCFSACSLGSTWLESIVGDWLTATVCLVPLHVAPNLDKMVLHFYVHDVCVLCYYVSE